MWLELPNNGSSLFALDDREMSLLRCFYLRVLARKSMATSPNPLRSRDFHEEWRTGPAFLSGQVSRGMRVVEGILYRVRVQDLQK